MALYQVKLVTTSYQIKYVEAEDEDMAQFKVDGDDWTEKEFFDNAETYVNKLDQEEEKLIRKHHSEDIIR
jgi:hypothetical protein